SLGTTVPGLLLLSHHHADLYLFCRRQTATARDYIGIHGTDWIGTVLDHKGVVYVSVVLDQPGLPGPVGQASLFVNVANHGTTIPLVIITIVGIVRIGILVVASGPATVIVYLTKPAIGPHVLN